MKFKRLLFVTNEVCLCDKSFYPYAERWLLSANISVIVVPNKPPKEYPYSRFTRWEKDPGFIKGVFTSVKLSYADVVNVVLSPHWLADLCASIVKELGLSHVTVEAFFPDLLKVVPATTFFAEHSAKLRVALTGLTLDSILLFRYLAELSDVIAKGGFKGCLDFLGLSTRQTGI